MYCIRFSQAPRCVQWASATRFYMTRLVPHRWLWKALLGCEPSEFLFPKFFDQKGTNKRTVHAWKVGKSFSSWFMSHVFGWIFRICWCKFLFVAALIEWSFGNDVSWNTRTASNWIYTLMGMRVDCVCGQRGLGWYKQTIYIYHFTSKKLKHKKNDSGFGGAIRITSKLYQKNADLTVRPDG